VRVADDVIGNTKTPFQTKRFVNQVDIVVNGFRNPRNGNLKLPSGYLLVNSMTPRKVPSPPMQNKMLIIQHFQGVDHLAHILLTTGGAKDVPPI
jgi:hypothetical protein